jgi:hypothetical protein
MGRSPEDVMLRYDFKIMKRKSGSWSREEDEQLMKIVSEVGPRWTLVGSRVGRTGPQCSLRYRLSLDPRLKWRLWTKEEVRALLKHPDSIYVLAYNILLQIMIG